MVSPRAIQDSLGWRDCYLHLFFAAVDGQMSQIGIPDDPGWDPQPVRASWLTRLAPNLTMDGQSFLYIYDFGDEWRHTITFEGVERRQVGLDYPVCLAGARACPPEDCGGPYGYAEFLEAIQNSKHPEHHSLLEWVGGSFDPEHFDPRGIVFSKPSQRLRRAGLGGAA